MIWWVSITISEKATLTPTWTWNQKLSYNLWKQKANLPDELQSKLNTLSIYFDLSSMVCWLAYNSFSLPVGQNCLKYVCFLFAILAQWPADWCIFCRTLLLICTQDSCPFSLQRVNKSYNLTLLFAFSQSCVLHDTVQEKGCVCGVQQRAKRSQKRLLVCRGCSMKSGHSINFPLSIREERKLIRPKFPYALNQ